MLGNDGSQLSSDAWWGLCWLQLAAVYYATFYAPNFLVPFRGAWNVCREWCTSSSPVSVGCSKTQKFWDGMSYWFTTARSVRCIFVCVSRFSQETQQKEIFLNFLSLSVRLTLSIPRFWRCWRLDERGTVHSLERSRRNAVDCWWAQAFLMDSRKYFSYSNTKNKFMNAAMMVANGRHTRTAAHTVHRFTQRHWNRTFLHR